MDRRGSATFDDPPARLLGRHDLDLRFQYLSWSGLHDGAVGGPQELASKTYFVLSFDVKCKMCNVVVPHLIALQ